MTQFKVDKICKRFGSREVLRSLSLDFAPGTITAIVGDNGAGKSTLLKVLAGIHTPEQGAVIFNGAPIQRADPNHHRTLGIELVHQDFALARNHDVIANLFIGREETYRLGYLNRRRMHQQARQRLEALHISIPDLKIPVRHLSGGQQQAVAIARALLWEPRVLLLDEPTAALAVSEVARVLDLMRRERDAGRVIAIVSHRLNDVLAVADRVVVLKHGTVFSDETAAQLSISDIVERIVS